MTMITKSVRLGGALIGLALPARIFAQQLTFAEGFVMMPIPTDGDPPGTVFRVDETGVRHEVGSLSRWIPVSVTVVAVPEFRSKRDLEANAFLRFVRRVLPASITGSGGQRSEVTLILDSARKEATIDSVVDAAIRLHLDMSEWRRGSTYFIVRDVIAAKGITYEFSKDFAATAGGDAALSALAQASAKVTYSSGQQRRLVQQFDKRMRVLYKVDRLVVPSGLDGATAKDIRRAPVTKEIAWMAAPSTR